MLTLLTGIKRNVALVVCLFIFAAANAQSTVHVVRASFTEATLAEVGLLKGASGFQRMADFNVNTDQREFAFPIPNDSVTDCRLQINFFKAGEGRHPKMTGTSVIPLSLKGDKNYSLTITPSKLDVGKNKGWDLKPDAALSSIALVHGKIVNAKYKGQVNLHRVANGELVSTGRFITNEQAEFVIPVQVKQEGFYYLSTIRWQARVYLKSGDNVELAIDHVQGAPVYMKGSAENALLFQWQQLISPLTSYGYYSSMFTDSVDMNSYTARYEKLQPAIAEFYAKQSKGKTAFANAFRSAMDIDRELAPINFLFQSSAKKIGTFRVTPRDFTEVPAFFQGFLQPRKFANASILMVGEARRFMELYAKMKLASLPAADKKDLEEGEKLKLMMNAISNDTLKSFFFQDQMGKIEVNNLSEFRSTFEPFKKYAKEGAAKASYESIYNQFRGDTAYIGKSSYNFSLPDTSGKMVSMKDFKGKVVFIDVWATWCGPCKAQIPFLKEVEEEYKNNKDIVFVGISLDKAGDEKKWTDFVRKENLQGVQLMDAGWKQFAKKYGIAAIPRFMLIDKQGKWIEIRCPLPESKERLKKYLDKALAG